MDAATAWQARTTGLELGAAGSVVVKDVTTRFEAPDRLRSEDRSVALRADGEEERAASLLVAIGDRQWRRSPDPGPGAPGSTCAETGFPGGLGLPALYADRVGLELLGQERTLDGTMHRLRSGPVTEEPDDSGTVSDYWVDREFRLRRVESYRYRDGEVAEVTVTEIDGFDEPAGIGVPGPCDDGWYVPSSASPQNAVALLGQATAVMEDLANWEQHMTGIERSRWADGTEQLGLLDDRFRFERPDREHYVVRGSILWPGSQSEPDTPSTVLGVGESVAIGTRQWSRRPDVEDETDWACTASREPVELPAWDAPDPAATGDAGVEYLGLEAGDERRWHRIRWRARVPLGPANDEARTTTYDYWIDVETLRVDRIETRWSEPGYLHFRTYRYSAHGTERAIYPPAAAPPCAPEASSDE
jgi:hypothetical protein